VQELGRRGIKWRVCAATWQKPSSSMPLSSMLTWGSDHVLLGGIHTPPKYVQKQTKIEIVYYSIFVVVAMGDGDDTRNPSDKAQ
jgi:hypothetical protein